MTVNLVDAAKMSEKPKRKWMKKAKAAEVALDKGKPKPGKGKTRSDRIASMYGKKHG